MNQYRNDFIDFLLETGALKFGSFTLKSGRESPYFFNSGSFDSASRLDRLGYFYAARAMEMGDPPSIVFGPAYKGIPLAVATALALKSHFDVDAGYCFDRKESKGHGDKGLLVGRVPETSDRVLMVDDVITDGLTKVEAIERLKGATDAPVTGIVIALNRQEKTKDGKDPVRNLEKLSGVPVGAIATLEEVIGALAEKTVEGKKVIDEETQRRIEDYRREYGIGPA